MDLRDNNQCIAGYALPGPFAPTPSCSASVFRHMYSIQSTDYLGVRIHRTLRDIKAFLKHDVDSLIECVAEYQSALAIAMKKGERIQTKLNEIGSRSSDDWRKYFTTLGQMQEVLNGTHASWIASMKDLFTTPAKGMLPGHIAALKNKSKMVKSALAHFTEEQEKSRNTVQTLLSRPANMNSVQPFYDSMRAKEELFCTKKQDILRDLEHFQLEKAYEISHLWAQVCSKQPHLSNTALLKRFAIERHLPPPLSDWTSYSKSKRPPLAEMMDGADLKHGNDNRNSLASSFYKGLKHLFQFHPKMDENDMLRHDLNSSGESTTFGTDVRSDPSAQVSPYNASILTAETLSSNSTPVFQTRNPIIRTMSDQMPFSESPHLSPIEGPSMDHTPPMEPRRAWGPQHTPDYVQHPPLVGNPSPTPNSIQPPNGSPTASTPLSFSGSMLSYFSESPTSPSVILEHLSPCSVASSPCDQSQDSDLVRAQEIANEHAMLAEQAVKAINALRTQNTSMEQSTKRSSSSLRVHYAPNIVTASYEAPIIEESDQTDDSTQDNQADYSCSTQTDSEYSEDLRSEDLSEFEDISQTDESFFEDLNSSANTTVEVPAQEISNSMEVAEDSILQENKAEESDGAQSSNSYSEYDGDTELVRNEKVASVEGYETSGADYVETIQGDSGASENSNDYSVDSECRTETGEESDDERENEATANRDARISIYAPRIDGWHARVSQTGRVMYIKKSDNNVPWTD